jgi:nucleotide-binding universal stress UspA family protein
MRINTVLFCTDLGILADQGVALASEVCRHFNARLVLHHNLDLLLPPYPMNLAERQKQLQHEVEEENQASEMIGKLISIIPKSIPVSTRLTRGVAFSSIVKLAKELPASLIVMGTHGRGSLGRFLLGSTTEQVIAQSPCPVLLFRNARRNILFSDLGNLPPRDVCRVLVPVDFSAESMQTLDQAFSLMRSIPIVVSLLHVMEPFSWLHSPGAGNFDVPEIQRECASGVRKLLEALIPSSLVGRVDVHVGVGHLVEQIVSYSTELGARLIMMGVRNKRKFDEFLFGPNVYAVLHHSSCPVWIVPESKKLKAEEIESLVANH